MPRPAPPEPYVALTLRLPASQYAQALKAAQEAHSTLSDWVRDAIARLANSEG